ncbi:SDR family oxidoreductase [Streptomyces sp. NPDC094472]|uniref:SDR family NAD(P)-dependent oxidoreductase n=1 Tax=unclassified Streptomyces TaxID=2593676 RepID=UPI0033287D1E
MDTQGRKVAVITGASQGIGAGLVAAYRKLGYAVVATSRSIAESPDMGGLQAATKALAIEYASRGIRSNAVALGTIKTPMHPEQHHAALAELHPVGRMGEVGDITDAVIYLENAPFVTGAILPVDGGQTAGH